ncbi:hypothetical protein EC968_010471 [Mortierella alpina]|nr:hypothetical protein EC968_010471 [Mortierella alpina]
MDRPVAQDEALEILDSTLLSQGQQLAPAPLPLASASSHDPAAHHDDLHHRHDPHHQHHPVSTTTSHGHAAYQNPSLRETPSSSASGTDQFPRSFADFAARFTAAAAPASHADTPATFGSRSTAVSAPTAKAAAAQPMVQVSASAWRYLQSLTTHLAVQGLFEGSGSDIQVRAFGKTYRLHRLILTQSAFFERMLNGPWKEHSLDQVDLRFDDANITRESFEIAIRRLYGVWTFEADGASGNQISHGQETYEAYALTSANVMAVLASATYLGLDSLCDQCTAYAIRAVSTEHVVEYVQFSHHHNYHPWSSKIAQACHAFLCRYGFEDPAMGCLHVFERLPVEWLSTVIASHAFWVPSEWDRYMFCRQVVRRRRANICQLQGQLSNELSKHADEEVYQRLFSTGIVYVHMTFEQLRAIMDDRDPSTGEPFVEPHILQQALWQQVELRTRVDGARREDCTLSVTVSEKSLKAGDLGTAGNQDATFEPVPERDRAAADVLQRVFHHHGNTAGTEETPLTPSSDSSTQEGEESGSKVNTRYSLYAPFRFSVAFKVDALRENLTPVCRTRSQAGEQGFELSSHAKNGPDRDRDRDQDQESDIDTERAVSEIRIEVDPSEHLEDHDEALDCLDFAVGETSPMSIEDSFSCYVDKREKTRTWFRIFAVPLKPTHGIMQFQSSPDDFAIMQSWVIQKNKGIVVPHMRAN